MSARWAGGTTPALAVVIPAGPADDVVDTVESVLHFTEPPRRIVIVDDTGRDLGDELRAMSPDLDVLPAPANARGGHGGLFVKLAAGYRRLLDSFAFDVLLRLDADALVIGPGIARVAAERFARQPDVGLLGSYRIDPDGDPRSFDWPAAALARECGPLGFQRPRMRATLRALRAAAITNGYEPGEHPLGGAYLHSAAAVAAIAQRGFLELSCLSRSRLGEDHLFALLTVATGFRIADLGGPEDPLALRWHGLPAAPEELLARGKLVTHSVRSWQGQGEDAIRAFFADARHLGRPGGANGAVANGAAAEGEIAKGEVAGPLGCSRPGG